MVGAKALYGFLTDKVINEIRKLLLESKYSGDIAKNVDFQENFMVTSKKVGASSFDSGNIYLALVFYTYVGSYLFKWEEECLPPSPISNRE